MKKKEARCELILHREYLKILSRLPQGEVLPMLVAMVGLAEDGEGTEFESATSAIAFDAFAERILFERKSWLEKKEKCRESGRLGGEATSKNREGSERYQTLPNATPSLPNATPSLPNATPSLPNATNSETKEKENEKEKEEKERNKEKEVKEKDKDKEKKKEYKEKEKFRKIFKPPTLEEVEDYIREKDFSVNAKKFISFYDSKGWMVGKNKMQNWRSAVSGWQARAIEEQENQPTQTLRTNGTNKSDRLESGLYDKEWKGTLYGYKSQVS